MTPHSTQKVLTVLPSNCQSSVTLLRLQDTKLMHRNLLHSYTLTIKDHKEKFREQSHLPSHQREYLGINLPEEAEDLPSEEADGRN